MRASSLALLSVLLWSSATLAEAPRANIGVLTCTLARSAEARPGSMTCGFKPTEAGSEVKLIGHIQGAMPLERGKLVLIWSVFGPTDGKVSGAMLTQKFVRARPAPGQPPAWIGESTPTIALQFETNNSAHADANITEIELKLAETAT
jgi:hypothetical protein